MLASETTPVTAHADMQDDVGKKHVRGSLLLLMGRLFSLGVSLAVQILIVRYLAKSDYGAFAFALSLVSTAGSLALVGLDKSLSRFVPIYQERREYATMYGAIVMMVATILGIGAALILVTFGLRGFLAESVITDSLAIGLLLFLIFLVPLQSLDTLFGNLLSVFAKPRAIFWRRYVLGPCIKLAAVLVVMLTGRDVFGLAVGYLVGGLLGLALYVWLLVQVLREQGLLKHFGTRGIRMPAKEIFSFNLPLLSHDLVFLAKGAIVVFLLQYCIGSSAVAEFRAVLPLARLNQVVMESFRFLYTPWAARLFARGDRAGMNRLYWFTAAWITVLSLPVFVFSFSLAGPVAVLFFGEQYAESGTVLAILSLGYYVNAAMGFNAVTLKVFGTVGRIVVNDLLAGGVALVTSVILVPRYGALGGAVVTAGTLIVHNALNQATLLRVPGMTSFPWRHVWLYSLILLCAVGLLLLQVFVAPPIFVGFGLAALGSIAVLWWSRYQLEVAQVFPDLMRFSLVRQWWGMRETAV